MMLDEKFPSGIHSAMVGHKYFSPNAEARVVIGEATYSVWGHNTSFVMPREPTVVLPSNGSRRWRHYNAILAMNEAVMRLVMEGVEFNTVFVSWGRKSVLHWTREYIKIEPIKVSPA